MSASYSADDSYNYYGDNYDNYDDYNYTSQGDYYNNDTYFYDYADQMAKEKVWFINIGVIGFIVCITGVACNLLSLGVLLSKDMRAPATYFLTWLAVYDLIYLFFNAMVTCLDNFYSGVTGKLDLHLSYYTAFFPAANAFQSVSLIGSVFTTVALSINRVIALKRPLLWPRMCTAIRVKIILLVVFLLSCLVNIPIMLELKHDEYFDEYVNKSVVYIAETDYSKSVFHRKVYLLALKPILTNIIPCIIIVGTNVLLLMALQHQRKRAASISGRAGRRESIANKRDEYLLTGQVIFISACTLVSRIMEMAVFIVMESYGTIAVNECALWCTILAAVAHLFNLINATVNFFCYCFFGTKFRRIFLQVYGCHSLFGRRISDAGKSMTASTADDILSNDANANNRKAVRALGKNSISDYERQSDETVPL